MSDKQLIISPILKELGNRVASKEGLEFGPARLEYVMVSPNISKKCAARCIRANPELAFFSDADYIIEFSEDVYDVLTDDTRYVLMLHELLHVDPLYNPKKGEWAYKIKDHDIKDFLEIIEKHGTEWFSGLQATVASLHDSDPGESISI